MRTFDVIVIGAGIAGASVAAHLAKERRVVVLEMEERAGFHSTGRSAASFEPNYGPSTMLAFTRASESFFLEPPKGFGSGPMLSPRETLFLVTEGQDEAVLADEQRPEADAAVARHVDQGPGTSGGAGGVGPSG